MYFVCRELFIFLSLICKRAYVCLVGFSACGLGETGESWRKTLFAEVVKLEKHYRFGAEHRPFYISRIDLSKRVQIERQTPTYTILMSFVLPFPI